MSVTVDIALEFYAVLPRSRRIAVYSLTRSPIDLICFIKVYITSEFIMVSLSAARRNYIGKLLTIRD